MGKSKTAASATEVLERFDPDELESEVDGDPNFEFKLNPETVPADRVFKWAHNDDKDLQIWTRRGAKVETYQDGGVRLQGQDGPVEEGASICVDDHVLVSIDRVKEEKRVAREMARNAPIHKKLQRNATNDVRLRPDL